MRELDWYKWKQALLKQSEVSLKINLSEPVRETISYCITTYHSIDVRIPKDLCLKRQLVSMQSGDRISVIGNWRTQLITANQIQKSFIQASKVEIELRPPRSPLNFHWWVRHLHQLHQQVVLVYQRSLPDPEASLIAGMVIGEQSNLAPDFQEALKRTGLMHVVAASGYNVVVVISAISLCTVKWFGRRWGSVCSLLGIGLYVLLAGASPPVIRAGIMGMFMIVSILTGRLYWTSWSLLLTIWVMLVWAPWLIVSISFQLTVAATLGLLSFSKPSHNPIIESFVTTLAATIANRWPTTSFRL